MWRLTICGNGQSTAPKTLEGDHFPASEIPDGARDRFDGKEEIYKAALEILNRVNAFEVGNPFRIIRRFDNADKHDTMLLVASLLKGADLKTAHHGRLMLGDLAPKPPGFMSPKNSFPILKDGQVLMITSERGAEADLDHELAFEIAFGDGEVLEREPVLPALKNLAAGVNNLAAAFVAEGLLR